MHYPTSACAAGPAELQLPCEELQQTLDFFTKRLGFRVETIFPAEEPTVASLSGHGLRLRLAPGVGDPSLIRLPCDDLGPDDERLLTAPNGTRIELVEANPPPILPELQPAFHITRKDGGPAANVGRAGMIYRDLIPGRLGGRYIASHITIAHGGPVADWVHFHKIRFQIIFCRQGWARLAYEGQGPAFIFSAGDCVVQPPEIRHRVLESSDAFQVVEIGCPALHETLADHDMTLPSPLIQRGRDFAGQVFIHHVAADTPWKPYAATGFEQRETGVGRATDGVANVQVLRPATFDRLDAPPHQGELLMGFLLEGSAQLEARGRHPLGVCDAFVIPPGESWSLDACSADAVLLLVTSPALQPDG